MNRFLGLKCKVVVLIFLLTGCKKDDSTDEIQKTLNGKYSILSATADKKIDVNFDGVESSDLLKEIATLKESFLELIIRDNDQSYVFSQFWQNQYFNTSDENIPIAYDPKVLVNYMNQATVSSFTINPDGSKLLLDRKVSDASFPLPESVEILKNQDVKITMAKSLYTSSGWQKTSVIVVYHKFSSDF